jgi:hypothetical protein
VIYIIDLHDHWRLCMCSSLLKLTLSPLFFNLGCNAWTPRDPKKVDGTGDDEKFKVNDTLCLGGKDWKDCGGGAAPNGTCGKFDRL